MQIHVFECVHCDTTDSCAMLCRIMLDAMLHAASATQTA